MHYVIFRDCILLSGELMKKPFCFCCFNTGFVCVCVRAHIIHVCVCVGLKIEKTHFSKQKVFLLFVYMIICLFCFMFVLGLIFVDLTWVFF